MAGELWTARLTRGLWSVVQSSVRDGFDLAGVRDAARAAGEAPDAATLSHLYARAVGSQAVARREADYRGRVDRDTYLARRPSGQLVAPLPRGFSLAGRYRQVVKVIGTNVITGATAEQFVNVQFDRLLSRGEAIDLATAAVEGDVGRYQMTVTGAEYETTWGLG